MLFVCSLLKPFFLLVDPFFKKKIYILFIYFRLCWAGFSLVVASGAREGG